MRWLQWPTGEGPDVSAGMAADLSACFSGGDSDVVRPAVFGVAPVVAWQWYLQE